MKVEGFETKDGYAAVPFGKEYMVIFDGKQMDVFSTPDDAYKFIKAHRNQPKVGTVFIE